jgi:2-polyprenyl-3-methyl-5-hydroxy-6-metoxy-1,4-benzoquinol methylase
VSAATGEGRDPAHYSYAHYANAGVADAFDALRFSGPIGSLLAETQERLLERFLGPLAERTLLDVGTGTGRAAIALARRGARVTAVDASAEMLAVARRRAADAGVRVTFDRGDAHALPFADGAFDAAVALRVLMHTPGWRRCLAELCRVSQSRIVFDYPSAMSLAALHAAARRCAGAFGGNVEAYRVFRPGRIRAALSAEGFRVTGIHRQFVLPIALHKAIGSRGFTERSEAALRAVRLDRPFGSPVTVLAERCVF